jgi:hypothetical protein
LAAGRMRFASASSNSKAESGLTLSNSWQGTR